MNKTRIRFRPPSPPLVSMTNPAMNDRFLDESDYLYEVDSDEENLPDADDDDDDDDGDEIKEEDKRDDSIHRFIGHEDVVCALACSPVDPTLVATGGEDNQLFLWRIMDDAFVNELPSHNDTVTSLAFSYDGQLLASGGLDGVVQVFDALSGSLRCHFDAGGEIEWLKWHPREHIVLAGLENGSLWMCDASNNANPNVFYGHNKSVTCGDFTPDGRLITGSYDGSMRVWNQITRTSIHVVRVHRYDHAIGLICLDIDSSSTRVITGSEDGSVHIVSIVTGRVVTSLNSHTDSVECVKISPSSSTIPMAATCGMDKKLMIWDLQHSALRFTCDHESGVTCVTWIGASKYLATGCADGTLSVWDSLLGNCVMTFHGHSDPVLAISVSANSEFIVSVSEDETARVYRTSEFLN